MTQELDKVIHNLEHIENSFRKDGYDNDATKCAYKRHHLLLMINIKEELKKLNNAQTKHGE